MKILRTAALKAAETVVRRLTVREPDGWVSDSMRGYAGEAVTINSALSLSTVWANVNLIAGTAASLPFAIFREGKDGREADKGHPLYRILHDSPNYDQTALDFWEFMFAALELDGNAYARIERDGSRIVGLIPVAPILVSVRRATNGMLEYSWSENGKAYVETDQTMFHVRGFGGGPLGGMSTLRFARHSFSLASAIERAAGSTFKNGLRPSGVLTTPTVLRPDQRDAVEAGLQKKFAGAMNAGVPMVLEGGTTWQALTINPEDAQMLESRRFSVEEICRFFGVPPFMIGHNEKSSGYPKSLEQQVLTFLKFSFRRRLLRVELAIKKQLFTAQDRAAGLVAEINLEGLLRADSEARARFYQIMTSIGAMTINEVRARENLPRVEGGDVPRMQMQNQPITEMLGHNGGPALDDEKETDQ